MKLHPWVFLVAAAFKAVYLAVYLLVKVKQLKQSTKAIDGRPEARS